MKVLKRWHGQEFDFLGDKIALEIKALSAAEAPGFLTQISKTGEAARSGDGNVMGLLDTLPEQFVSDCFTRFVRLAEPVEIDGREVKTGADLVEHAGYPLVMAVMFAIERLAAVGHLEGKASGRPSTSASEPKANGGPSDATPIEPGAGQPPSTATPTPAGPESSGALPA